MNSHSFLPFGDKQNHRNPFALNNTNILQKQGANGSSKSAFGDSYLRSYALTKARQGNYIEAIALLSQLIHRHPHNAIDYNNRGLIYFQSGETQKAFCDYNTALQLNPKLASAYNNRANYYAACGELVAAIADYDRALDLNPSHVRAWINRGITLRDLGQYEEAIENFEVALLFGQLEGHIIAERGRTYHLWGDWNCAIADYRRALSQLPFPGFKKEDPGSRLRLQVENWLHELLRPQHSHW
ncbi:tetratricopeptide repeat protein [Mastigocladopsis repens]|uniref:tetratricopeptide repeat protein n=1 Tax=Mastigocladopsis repens TaxID=221287 RepID=UPI0002DD5A5C|nr:tetratricopeptide repeat protein [Mastigocladopsis repens]